MQEKWPGGQVAAAAVPEVAAVDSPITPRPAAEAVVATYAARRPSLTAAVAAEAPEVAAVAFTRRQRVRMPPS